MRTIYLPAVDRTVTLGAYVNAVKLAKQNPTDIFKHGLTCWWSCSGAEIMQQFRSGIHDRINQAVPYVKRVISDPKQCQSGEKIPKIIG